MADQNTAGGRGRPGPVHRLTFDYEGDRISLVSDQVVKMIGPPGQPLDEAETSAGFSVIVRDAADRALYRRTGSSPIRSDAEVFSDDPSTPLHRVPVQEPRGTFVMLVPHVEGAVSVELVGQPSGRPERFRESRRLARFPLNPPQDLS
jgi:hypothetical protein